MNIIALHIRHHHFIVTNHDEKGEECAFTKICNDCNVIFCRVCDALFFEYNDAYNHAIKCLTKTKVDIELAANVPSEENVDTELAANVPSGENALTELAANVPSGENALTKLKQQPPKKAKTVKCISCSKRIQRTQRPHSEDKQ